MVITSNAEEEEGMVLYLVGLVFPMYSTVSASAVASVALRLMYMPGVPRARSLNLGRVIPETWTIVAAPKEAWHYGVSVGTSLTEWHSKFALQLSSQWCCGMKPPTNRTRLPLSDLCAGSVHSTVMFAPFSQFLSCADYYVMIESIQLKLSLKNCQMFL